MRCKILAASIATACAPDGPQAPCTSPRALFTDIDETLTTSDAEFVTQLGDGLHDPQERPDAATLVQGYARRGYQIVYITARGEDLRLPGDVTARQATVDWLVGHGFPVREELVFLFPGLFSTGAETVQYKRGVMDRLAAEGMQFDFGYGNAETDIEAARAHGIPEEGLFLVGELAGQLDVAGIPDDQAFTGHLPQLSGVPSLCDVER